MQQFNLVFKIISDGLRLTAKNIENMANSFDAILNVSKRNEAEGQNKPSVVTSEGTEKPSPQSAPTTVSKPVNKEIKPPQKATKPIAADVILNHISDSKDGIDLKALMEKTGYDKRKVGNIIYKLKKRNQIITPQKGMYKKA